MGKLDLDFVILDESVVDYGCRCLMTGAELDEFKANPVMLYQHLRAGDLTSATDEHPMLPIGKWYDIRTNGGKLLAKPDFDDDDTFAKKVEGKVKKGYINACSAWVDPVSCSEDETLMIPGQIGPTITQFKIREISIVDIPGCRNSLAIRNAAGKLLKLSSVDSSAAPQVLEHLRTLLPIKNNSEMDTKIVALKLGLKETATESEVAEKLASVLTLAGTGSNLVTENDSLKKQLSDLKLAADKKKVEELVDGGITAKKLIAGERESYIKLATADFETTKSVIDGKTPYASIESQLDQKNNDNSVELPELLKLSGHELYLSGKLERLKDLSADHFKVKYKDAFGIEYKGK
ncbi:hypothetical protein SAMN05428988_1321 [Chitinophaga sp. YR573]|uniref:hypothetical protein n=1 Tax=Chitinophaga sp. YR573 TaxID=1881040 RepID=UPI0008B61473|nr:hypothetical protein [Chitinophaga sp. YR573]SEW02012.1 hypothetical protein SAMN05428988_1321 [Chitinophaga sp. YR573]